MKLVNFIFKKKSFIYNKRYFWNLIACGGFLETLGGINFKNTEKNMV